MPRELTDPRPSDIVEAYEEELAAWNLASGIQYHSTDWMGLVETGWLTMYVENGIATMKRKP